MFENLKTVFLLTVLTLILVGIGYFIGSLFGIGQFGALIALLIAAVMNFTSYFFSDRIVLRMYRAKEVSEAEAPVLHQIVSELSMNAGIPKPRIAIIETATPNAFATGRSPSNAVVAVTTGILNLLDRDELEGVIAHELSHVKHRDILISAVVATVAGAIAWIANFAQFFAFFGGDGDDAGGILGLILMSIFAPIAAMLIQLAISRSREFKADEGGAKVSGKPWALANALRKLEMGINARPMDANPSTAHMFIANPFGGRGSRFVKLFSTHPPMEERIHKLMEM
ncbi:zinc metalloprotease HtpX [Methanobacterium aggregans]|uniref:zinc metalloprotease HtpX n=1 Tax=Methanobacterium aggregans TaxID=1615586 RepID=UPI001AE92D0E|nr:zinc metalloprotease HtpX [Methanobacterium aggregans]MBP2046274.1 heat shock protein HtpX [Methanobacterium aggregans]